MDGNATASAADRNILRELGRQKHEIGHLPHQAERFGLWRRLNDLQPVRPLVWFCQVPWHEFTEASEVLRPRCEDPFLRSVETALRQELYQWRHFPGDMIVEPILYSETVCSPTSVYAYYGIDEKLNVAEGGHDVGYIPVIHSLADADRIRTPDVIFDREATERNYARLSDIFSGVLPVRKRGIVHQWHSPWDMIIHWYGIEQLYTDMYEQPELIHRIMTRFMAALNEVLDRQSAMGLLDVGNGNYHVGSGGLGVTSALPADGIPPGQVTLKHQWGCATAQIFSEVSPDMHEEFTLQYERPLMERFGLSYYGCCEPLHKKISILRSIRNLRVISMSPWVNAAEGAEAIGRDYVFAYKPNPAHVAMEAPQPDLIRNTLRETVRTVRSHGCNMSLILKDITTVRGDPRRLTQWEQIAMQVVQDAG